VRKWVRLFLKNLDMSYQRELYFPVFIGSLFAVLVMEPRASHMLGKCFTTKPHPQPQKASRLAVLINNNSHHF
jgi:hypothetical protein